MSSCGLWKALFVISFCLVLSIPAGAENPRSLSLDERVECQLQVERFYYQNGGYGGEPITDPLELERILPRDLFRERVIRDVRLANALGEIWSQPVSLEDLQAEMNRMARETLLSEGLKELFNVLDNDPFLISECYVRPLLAQSRIRQLFSSDESIHGPIKEKAESELASVGRSDVAFSGSRRELEIRRIPNRRDSRRASPQKSHLDLTGADWDQEVNRLRRVFGLDEHEPLLPEGKVSRLHEDDERYFAVQIVQNLGDSIRLEVFDWPKADFEQWWETVEDELDRPIETVDSSQLVLPVVGQSLATPTAGVWKGTATSNAPSARWDHIAEGSFVWGGRDTMGTFSSGKRFDPYGNAWYDIATTGSPPSARYQHAGVYAQGELVVWGGRDASGNYLGSGAIYHPGALSWRTMTSVNKPDGRARPTLTNVGTKVLLFGGGHSTDAYSDAYYFDWDAATQPYGEWSEVTAASGLGGRELHTATRITDGVLIWGGERTFEIISDVWTTQWHQSGAVLSTVNDTWSSVSTTGAPSHRSRHVAATVDGGVAIWGGETTGGGAAADGAIYDPDNDTWTAMPSTGAPAGRRNHTIWKMGGSSNIVVWGGSDGDGDGAAPRNDGGYYNSVNRVWLPVTTTDAPSARQRHRALTNQHPSSSSPMVVWGGKASDGSALGSGGIYTQPTDLVVSCTERSLHIPLGGAVDFPNCTAQALGEFEEVVTFSCSGLPGTFSNCWFENPTADLTGGGAVTGITTVNILPTGASTGDYSATVRGTSSSFTRDFDLDLHVSDYSLGCTQSSFTLRPGESDATSCTVSSLAGFDLPTELACVDLGGGVDCEFSPTSPLSVPADGTVGLTMTISVGAGATDGVRSGSLQATAGGATRSFSIELDADVPFFTDGFESGSVSAWSKSFN
jgi:hypothetical protein